MAGAVEGDRNRLDPRLAPISERRWMSEFCSNREANRLFCARRQTREIRRIGCRTHALRFASSAQAPRHAGIFRSLQIVGKHYRLLGGEGWIRTPGTASAPMGGIRPEVCAVSSRQTSKRATERKASRPSYRTKNSMLFPYRFANSANSITSIRLSPDSHFETYD